MGGGSLMIHAQTINADSRRIVDTYTLENNYRVKIYTYHDKTRKAYLSVIKECVVSETGTAGIYFERSRPYVDLNHLLKSERATRYSLKDLTAAHAVALELGVELRDKSLEINADITAQELANA
jgi:hypothetical protein